ncbi:PREDICTED: protein UPSTREAM OF FLC-like isoform X2 [Ipomoea nil]|uniref:protein UPSTREAM OF FLC-like isoform X2 n=1 Tax=Ipomoea nil TaxID=35883 RepID=UPI0009013950|nr:PREDICTED: protein UPSTREAM OF FLC-like isoform X2 [Ipomoea nil]
MAATSRSAKTTMELYTSKRWKHTAAETSPERTRVWTEPPNAKPKSERKVAVVYYLSRNGQLEHPHFMEVPLSSPEGLYLRDVINSLNFLRGKGLASLYSWSAKRSYKNGFVWHDLSENDFIYPAHGQEYVLKGSELMMDGALISPSEELGFSSSAPLLPDVRKSGEYPVTARRRNQSWSSSDFHEYRVYKAESTGESSGRAADASTQTDDKRRRRRPGRVVEEEDGEEKGKEQDGEGKTPVRSQSTELSRGEISPPPSDSSPETLETLMKADGRLVLRSEPAAGEDATAAKGKPKSPSVLLQLLSCGSISFRDCGAGHGKDHGFSLISHYKARLPRAAAAGGNHVEKDLAVEFPVKVNLEDKEYFSGSLIETKKEAFPGLKRSSSYNAERSSKLELTQQEIAGVRAKCIPRKPKTQVDTSQHGSKRMAPQS